MSGLFLLFRTCKEDLLMAALPSLLFMIVEEYRQLPDQSGAVQELHRGQLTTEKFPKMKHTKLQLRLACLLRPKAEQLGSAGVRASLSCCSGI